MSPCTTKTNTTTVEDTNKSTNNASNNNTQQLYEFGFPNLHTNSSLLPPHLVHNLIMASRDLTANFIERRNAALKRRGPGVLKTMGPRLTAGGTDDVYSLSLMEVRLGQ
jgi:hypothetical protein